MKGFFSESTLTQKKTESLIPKCGACGLYKDCKTPKMIATGVGYPPGGILFVGDYPSREEDLAGKHNVGDMRKLLAKEFMVHDVLLRDCAFTNALACHPRKESPTTERVNHCRPKIRQLINDIKPRVIVPMGLRALQSVIPLAWEKSIEETSEAWMGWQIPSIKLNAWICPTFRPEFVFHEAKDEVAKILFRKHLAKIFEHESKPYVSPPDYKRLVRIELNPKEAANVINTIPEDAIVAFDYETNMLKPDSDEAAIISCAVCWGPDKVIAFPWMGKAILAMIDLLLSKRKKIAANMKFEERWSKAMVCERVRNWWWDTMQAAHVLDHRRGITGLKFQAFVTLGVPEYASHIEPFFHSAGGNKPNRIKELELKDLLLYNGLDALLEYNLAFKQRLEFGYGDA